MVFDVFWQLIVKFCMAWFTKNNKVRQIAIFFATMFIRAMMDVQWGTAFITAQLATLTFVDEIAPDRFPIGRFSSMI